MTLLKRLGLLGLCAALGSCGGSAKTGGMSFQEFKDKIETMFAASEAPCPNCNGSGKVTDAGTGGPVNCPECNGTGKAQGIPLADFEATFGKPVKEENVPGDLITEYWFFPCTEGTVRLRYYLTEKRGDVVRVVREKVELVE